MTVSKIEIPTRINFAPSEHDAATLRSISEAYPHLGWPDIFRQLIENWRLSRENGSRGERIEKTMHNSEEILLIARRIEKKLLLEE